MTNAEKYQQEFAKRIIISAGFYFGRPRQLRRNVANWISQNSRQPSTHEDVRAALNIKSDIVWTDFVSKLLDTRCLIRTSNPIHGYSSAQLADSVTPDAARKVEMVLKIDRGNNQPQQQAAPGGADISQQLQQMERQLDQIRSESAQKIDEAKKVAADNLAKVAELKKQIAETKANEPTVVVVENKANGQRVELSIQHKQLPALLVRLAARLSVYLIGPAGSGKTFAAEAAAKALGLPFGFMSVGPQTTKTDILGYQSATGNYVDTEFRRRYEHGGIFLFDEIDAGNGGVLTCINASLAGSCAAFPDKMIVRHADFICVAAGNTYGNGPDRVYVGRQELDGASLDRFDFLDWGYDEALECHIAESICATTAKRWVPVVQAARKAIGQLNIRHVVSPRASINGVKLLRDGVEMASVMQTALWKSLKTAEIDRVQATMRSNGFTINA